MFKITVFIPISAKETVKQAMFSAGAGRVGSYDNCCFELEGIGQFKPLSGSNPSIGSHDKIETVKEVRVEMVVADDYIRSVIKAMKEHHPYETPAYDVIRMEDF